MFDLMMGIDRRMKYLEGALPVDPATQGNRMTKAEAAALVENLLPLLAYRSGKQSKNEGDDGERIFPPADPIPLNKIHGLTDEEKLLRLLTILGKGRDQQIAESGHEALGPFVYVFVGRKVYRQDAAGNRELQVDGDRVRVEVDERGYRTRWFVDSVEVERDGRIKRPVPSVGEVKAKLLKADASQNGNGHRGSNL